MPSWASACTKQGAGDMIPLLFLVWGTARISDLSHHCSVSKWVCIFRNNPQRQFTHYFEMKMFLLFYFWPHLGIFFSSFQSHSFLFENSRVEEASQDEQLPTNKTTSPGTADRHRTVISVPRSTLRSIRCYRGDYDAYLRAVAHEDVSSFDPWAVADR